MDPIVIDLTGRGFHLTAAADGVNFGFNGTGTRIQKSWTAANWEGGFLALDRNGNGSIDNGGELFSNISPQSGAVGKGNGFLALAVYDQPANGGNGDGWIDEHDAVFSKLLVWVDRNHNGISEPSELLTLKKAGIRSISLDYSKNSWTDIYGNHFRYRAQFTRSSPANLPPQWVYDVILKVGQ